MTSPDLCAHDLSATIGEPNSTSDQALRKWAVEQAVLVMPAGDEVLILYAARVFAQFALTGTTSGLTAELVRGR